MNRFHRRQILAQARQHEAARKHAYETDDLTPFIADINALIKAQNLTPLSSSLVYSLAFHKARLDAITVSNERRRESQAFLAAHGSTDLRGNQVKRGDPLPGRREVEEALLCNIQKPPPEHMHR